MPSGVGIALFDAIIEFQRSTRFIACWERYILQAT